MKLVSKALKDEDNYDLLISIAVPHTIHWGVAKARKINPHLTKIWVADCGDPYLKVQSDTFQKMPYFKYVELWWGKKADFLSVPIQDAIKAYHPAIRSKIKIIPQGFKFSDLKPIKIHKNKIPTFAYGGGFIPNKRDPRNFLEYLIELDQDYLFYIFTSSKEMVRSYAERSNNKIIVKDPIPRNEFLGFLSSMDFVINFENSGTQQLPSKLIDYAIIAKPILSLDGSNIDQEKVGEFLERNYDRSLKIADIEQYRIENVVNEFLILQN